MTDRTCSVDGCENRVVARGWCRMHYSRWYKHGSVNDPRPRPVVLCSVDGCQKVVKARGWCVVHYWRWQQHGTVADPTPRSRSLCSVEGCEQFVVGQGWCRKHYSRWYKHGTVDDPEPTCRPVVLCSVPGCVRPALARTWCDKHYRRWSKYGSVELPGSHPPPGFKWCRKCSAYRSLVQFYFNKSGRVLTPCRQCQITVAAADGRRRRAIKRRAIAEPYTAEEIADRDGWICQIATCRKPISRTLQFPHKRSLSIDHIVPISKGGDDVKANVQATHLRCNLAKGNRGIDQLRLIG